MKCNILYKSWAPTKRQNCGIEQLGEPKGHPGGQPKGFFVCINIGELEGIRDFFPERFVRIWCKKNNFLLHKEITSFYWRKLCGIFQMLCHGFAECVLFHFQSCVHELWDRSNSLNLCSCYECTLVYSMKFPLWVMNVVHKQLAIWLFIYL